ncbi:uncharacterized protein L201_006532 [Kwoniella dendrophila CBS 6074]|uniref:Uncharacterized protein n=1 Tax=Kwoniella dendrophila CBS 6074 TaxID=1295534 RepID=A0AAX4K1I7_9TREE
MKFSSIFTAALLTFSLGAVASPIDFHNDLVARTGGGAPTVPAGYKLISVGNVYVLTDANGNFAGAFAKGTGNGSPQTQTNNNSNKQVAGKTFGQTNGDVSQSNSGQNIGSGGVGNTDLGGKTPW